MNHNNHNNDINFTAILKRVLLALTGLVVFANSLTFKFVFQVKVTPHHKIKNRVKACIPVLL